MKTVSIPLLLFTLLTFCGCKEKREYSEQPKMDMDRAPTGKWITVYSIDQVSDSILVQLQEPLLNVQFLDDTLPILTYMDHSRMDSSSLVNYRPLYIGNKRTIPFPQEPNSQ